MSTWQERHIEDAERMIAFAHSQMPPGQIGAVPTRITTEIDEIPLEMLGDRPPTMTDRHLRYEEDFNALVAIELEAGRITLASAEQAASNFHVYVSGNRYVPPQTSPRFYE